MQKKYELVGKSDLEHDDIILTQRRALHREGGGYARVALTKVKVHIHRETTINLSTCLGANGQLNV
jgi:hypothetical protein